MMSGLYIVTLNNDELISVNSKDPRRAGRCIEVNRAHCKLGKARDLSIRKRNYDKVFGTANVNFEIIARLLDIGHAERLVLESLREWRIRGRAGRKNEWLQGIAPSEVRRLAITRLQESGLPFELAGG